MIFYIELTRSGDYEQAFHSLRELDDSALSAFQDAYRSQTDPKVRSLLVHAIWQHRQPSVIGFLGDVLQDPAPEVWKQALDGLVTLATPEARRVLQSVAVQDIDEERRDWIVEAIEQITDSCS
jgi:hypothetical protein